MLPASYDDILRREGFAFLGRIDYRLSLSLWWNPAADQRTQLLILTVGQSALLKASKTYCLQSASEQGETWARDIPALHDYLEDHFPEIHLSFSHFRDVPAALAELEARRRVAADAPTRPPPTLEQIALLQREIDNRSQGIATTRHLMTLGAMESDLLSDYAHRQAAAQTREIEALQAELQQQQHQSSLLKHLQREYQRKGSAAVYQFTINSNLQTASNPREFGDALRQATKEVSDLHRYQITQKLQGGKLNIQVSEAEEPAIAFLQQWTGGALSPTQLQRLGPEFESLRQKTSEHVIVVPDEPIVVDHHLRQAEKHLAARILSTVMQRLDRTEDVQKAGPQAATPGSMPLLLGWRVDDTGNLLEPARFPLTQMIHLYISGTSGSGKSYLGRVLLEEAASHKSLSILVLDPRNQSIGLLIPEDRPKVLEQYEPFGMKRGQAHGFAFDYFAPGLPYAPSLPQDLSQLASGRSIVSLKGLDDQQRCALAAAVLDAVFKECTAEESESPRLLLVVDEAHLFTRRNLDASAKSAAAQAERAMERIAREGRKFGIVLGIISQSMKDFSHELASIRQMTTTKVFFHNSDREIDYAAEVLGDGRPLVQLPTATAIVHNADWPTMRIRVRPPFSQVREPGETEVRRLLGQRQGYANAITRDAQQLLEIIRQQSLSAQESLNLSGLAVLAGISSKRKLQELIGELVRTGLVRTRKLPERGRPCVIELSDASHGSVSGSSNQKAGGS